MDSITRPDLSELRMPDELLTVDRRRELARNQQARLAARILDVVERHAPAATASLAEAVADARNGLERARTWAALVVDIAEVHAPEAVAEITAAIRTETTP